MPSKRCSDRRTALKNNVDGEGNGLSGLVPKTLELGPEELSEENALLILVR